MKVYDKPVRGHTPVRRGPGDWRCKCGERLRSWRFLDGDEGPTIPLTGRAGARDCMRFHRADLNHPEHVTKINLAGTVPASR
jgi:hypothetical protein